MTYDVKPKELSFGRNLIREDYKVYSLPSLQDGFLIEDGEEVEVIFMCHCTISIQSIFPISCQRDYGSRVLFNTLLDYKNMSCRFIFDSVKQRWVLLFNGYLLFCESEINNPIQG